jgi:hypothetical protein
MPRMPVNHSVHTRSAMSTIVLTPEFIMTFLLFMGAVAGVGLLVWVEKRPRDTLQPRLLPTTPLILSIGFVGLLALVHLVNLAGVHTGR